MGSLDATIVLSFSGTQDIADSVGNALTNTAVQGIDESSWMIDRVFPTVTVTGPAGPVSGAFTATFTFSEDVTGFELGDISVANGAASNLSGSGAVYTATITPEADVRYADGCFDSTRNRIICVREDHTGEGEAVNSIVAVDANGEGEPEVLYQGSDFCSNPRISPDGSVLCWLI